MWYPGDEDEEFTSIIESIEKKETQEIKIKTEKLRQSSLNQLSIEQSEGVSSGSEFNDNSNKTSNTDTPTKTAITTTMNNNNERILSTSTGYDIRLPPNSIEQPSPSFISSSQDGVLTIDSSLPVDVEKSNKESQSPPNGDNQILNNNNMFFKDITSLPSTDIDSNSNNNNNDNPLKQTMSSSPSKTTNTTTNTINITTNSTTTTPSLSSSSNNNSSTVSTVSEGLENLNLKSGIKKIDSETEKYIEEGKQVFVNFLKGHTCYDVIPISGKVVVLDTKLAVKSAFYALEENGIKSAPLWNSEQHDFTGMITVSDFIDILLYYYRKPKSNNIFQDMGIHRIETFWREISVERPSSLISTEPETNLYDAASLLLCYKIHRLPVVDKKDTNSILHILTHSRILAFMMKSLPQLPEKLLSIPIGSLGIGTFATVVTVMTHTPLVEVLELLSEKKISAVPIIDSETSKIVDVYSKSDVTLMSKQGILSPSDLNLPVHQVLSTFTKLWQRPEQIYTCTRFDKLGDVIERCIKKRVHRLVCIDSSKKVEGILSLSDILNYLLNDVKSINH
ncbi:hypothetical protein RB653_010340 [Dictyostelium firmibasis]|uniref:CBS domain-containing protein n=1 Tax=Dictyostelium firmibasis TaxID=79012 RepID=A0AAN7TLE1_9MYCE